MAFRQGQRIRYTAEHLACVQSDHIVNAGDTGIYQGPAAVMDGYEGWHITVVTLQAEDNSTEVLVCPVHETMFEAID